METQQIMATSELTTEQLEKFKAFVIEQTRHLELNLKFSHNDSSPFVDVKISDQHKDFLTGADVNKMMSLGMQLIYAEFNEETKKVEANFIIVPKVLA